MTTEQHQLAVTVSAGPGDGAVATDATQAETAPVTRRIRIASPTSLLAVVPSLLGFRPTRSLVVIGTEPPRAEVRLTLRYDLPEPSDPKIAAGIAMHATAVLAAQGIRRAIAVGYGPGELVTPVADALRETAPGAYVTLAEVLRADDGRYWSYLCTNPACCPADGTPFDEETAESVLAALPHAGTQVLSSREELAATVAAVGGQAADSMRRATGRAEERAARLVAGTAEDGRRAARRAIADAGRQAVGDAIACYRSGSQLRSDDDIAWLTVMLRDLRVRDDAWSRMDPEHREAHLRMWTDITRLVQPGYVAPPAALLAFVAWQSGNGALANVALDRALGDRPGYSMAYLVRQAIDSGAPPALARLPMTPDEVAASYDAMDGYDSSGGEAGEDEETCCADDCCDEDADSACDESTCSEADDLQQARTPGAATA